MPALQRDISKTAGSTTNGAHTHHDEEDLDVLIIGAGFAGCYMIHHFRKNNFKAKIVEAGSGLGGVWHWNRYPGARVDTPYPAYALDIPEVWQNWYWSSKYPDHNEIRQYFDHIEDILHIKKDCYLGTKVVSTEWDDSAHKWAVGFDNGKVVRATYLIPGIGFAAKRHFPDWPGFETFKGIIHHSSFWPHEGVDVKGKRVAVVGTGATGVQITQETAKDVGPEGSVTVFQRTPNIALRMGQRKLTKEEQDKDRETVAADLHGRRANVGGFVIPPFRMQKTFDVSPEEREAFFEELWAEGGFGVFLSNYYDIMLDETSNRELYNFWRKKVHERVKDSHNKELLAPEEWPHPVSGKRPSLEQDYYDVFNRPNVNLVSVKETPVTEIKENGIVTADGKLHEADIIALATGFDAVTGGIRDIGWKGIGGTNLIDYWKDGTKTYLGLSVPNFPNMLFLYGPQAPTAFSNGPSCVEVQADWIVQLCLDMRAKGQTKVEATTDAQQSWAKEMREKHDGSIRKNTHGWYDGSNVPGKLVEPMNYSGGLPYYVGFLQKEYEGGYKGFVLS